MKGELKIFPIANSLITAESDRTGGFPVFDVLMEALKEEVSIDTFTKEELYEFFLDSRLHIALALRDCYSNGDGTFTDTCKITPAMIQQADQVVHNLHSMEIAYKASWEKVKAAIVKADPNYQIKFTDVECTQHPDLSEATLVTVMKNLALDGELELVLRKGVER